MARHALGSALRAALVKARELCPVHVGQLQPCCLCDRAFRGAESQRKRQRSEEQKAAHRQYLDRRYIQRQRDGG